MSAKQRQWKRRCVYNKTTALTVLTLVLKDRSSLLLYSEFEDGFGSYQSNHHQNKVYEMRTIFYDPKLLLVLIWINIRFTKKKTPLYQYILPAVCGDDHIFPCIAYILILCERNER